MLLDLGVSIMVNLCVCVLEGGGFNLRALNCCLTLCVCVRVCVCVCVLSSLMKSVFSVVQRVEV